MGINKELAVLLGTAFNKNKSIDTGNAAKDVLQGLYNLTEEDTETVLSFVKYLGLNTELFLQMGVPPSKLTEVDIGAGLLLGKVLGDYLRQKEN